MTNKEILQNFILAISPVMVDFLVCFFVVSLIVLFFLLIQKNTWVSSKKFGVVSLFYGLDKYGCLCLTCSLISVILLIVSVVKFKKINLINWIVYLIPSIISIFNFKQLSGIISRIAWYIVELSGLFVANKICVYYLNIYSDSWYILIYSLISILLVVLSVYRFLLNVEIISLYREVNYEQH